MMMFKGKTTAMTMTMALALAVFLVQGARAAEAKVPADEAAKVEMLTKQVRDLRDAIQILSNRVNQLASRARRAPRRESVDLDGAPVLGNHKAKIGIVEFSDFQCPYCRRFHELVYPMLKSRYIDTGKVDFMVRDFPLYFHKHAMNAAIAVSCMREQKPGAFWKIQHEMFTHQKEFGKDYYQKVAKKFGVDEKRYRTCIGEPKEKKHMQDALKYGRAVGVSGTPTFFIGRIKGDRLVDAVRVEGVQPLSVFSQVIGSLEDKNGS